MNKSILLILTTWIMISCDTAVQLELNDAKKVLVVDAWIKHEAKPQDIKLTLSRNYYDQKKPPGVKGAVVKVIDENNFVYDFIELDSGVYRWNPAHASDTFGQLELAYLLEITYNDNNYFSSSIMTESPRIDSITFRFEEGIFGFPDSYFGEFWSRDLPGPDDAYWIKAWKNGQYLNKPVEINIAYDGAFSRGGSGDSLLFIQPIRDGVNPFDQEKNGDFIPPFMIYSDIKIDTTDLYYILSDTQVSDSLYVEIHSITPDAFFFLQQVIVTTNREGGFGELFATPLSNAITNIVSENRDIGVVGYFNTGSVTSLGRRISFDAIREVKK